MLWEPMEKGGVGFSRVYKLHQAGTGYWSSGAFIVGLRLKTEVL